MSRFLCRDQVVVLPIAPYIRSPPGGRHGSYRLREPSVIERALVDYCRCPEHLVTMALAGDLSSDSGYFRFGTLDCLPGEVERGGGSAAG
jgi:hypothetical protein